MNCCSGTPKLVNSITDANMIALNHAEFSPCQQVGWAMGIGFLSEQKTIQRTVTTHLWPPVPTKNRFPKGTQSQTWRDHTQSCGRHTCAMVGNVCLLETISNMKWMPTHVFHPLEGDTAHPLLPGFWREWQLWKFAIRVQWRFGFPSKMSIA